jgi:hypothetical protein
MGIGPHESSHRGLLQDNYFVRFVSRTSVMCEQWAANRYNHHEQRKRYQQFTFHPEDPELKFAA